MMERSDSFDFALEESAPLGVIGKTFGQKLDGDIPVEFEVARFPDDTHTSLAELLIEAVLSQDVARLEAHGSRSLCLSIFCALIMIFLHKELWQSPKKIVPHEKSTFQ
jgi:hypothetical protein